MQTELTGDRTAGFRRRRRGTQSLLDAAGALADFLESLALDLLDESDELAESDELDDDPLDSDVALDAAAFVADFELRESVL